MTPPTEQIVSSTPPTPDARAALVMSRCDALAGCSDEDGRITRLFLGPGMRRAHQLVSDWMRKAGLTVRTDAAGNLIGRRKAKTDDAPVLLLGSHLDSVPHAGRYDGVLGVLVALAAVEALHDKALPFHVDVIGFSEEEGVRFGLPYLGSRAIAGKFDAAWLNRTDANHVTMREAIHAFGLDPRKLCDCVYPREKMLGYMEVHIEQGPVLERENLPIGVVNAIAGQSRLKLSFTGKTGHAGTTPMYPRTDTLVTASRFIVAASEHGKSVPDLRVTVGQIVNEPNVANVIPGCTRLSLDVRHPNDDVRTRAVEDLLAQAKAFCCETKVRFEVEERRLDAAVAIDLRLADTLTRAVQDVGQPVRQLMSGAGHDAVPMAALCGVAMLFVRHPGGISHHPDERVEQADVAVAIDVLARAVTHLAQSNTP